MKEKVDLGPRQSLMVHTVSVDAKQVLKQKIAPLRAQEPYEREGGPGPPSLMVHTVSVDAKQC